MEEKRKKQAARILRQEELAKDIYSMWLFCPETAGAAKPGQFLNLFSRDGARLLPRPISICQMDQEAGSIRLVYRVAGKGTKEFSLLREGDCIEFLGPLGNGFFLKKKSALLIGGGIGIPPMVGTAMALRRMGCKVTAAVGYRTKELAFLTEELRAEANLYIASDDGTIGVHGTVVDAVKTHGLSADVIYACGPMPMLRTVKDYALPLGVEVQVSMEEKMACGIGACLACVCRSKDIDAHSNVHNKRICKDGPVFYAQDLEW